MDGFDKAGLGREGVGPSRWRGRKERWRFGTKSKVVIHRYGRPFGTLQNGRGFIVVVALM